MRTIRILSISLLLGLVGCATVSPPGSVPAGEAQSAREAMERGDYREAAREYGRLAAQTPKPLRNEYHLLSVEAMLKAGLLARAAQVLDRLETAELTPAQHSQLLLLRAENALLQHEPERVLAILSVPPVEATTQRRAAYHELRGRAFGRLGNHIETAREYLYRERFLQDPEAQRLNRLAIWESLSLLPEELLRQFALGSDSGPLLPWLELVRLAKSVRLPPEEVSLRVSAWRERYPNHPASTFIDSLLERSQALTVQAKNIALLLPVSGRYEKAGVAVRDGILAAYYAAHPADEVRIRIYDVGSNPARVLPLYEQAVREGADFVIGPLSKEGVEALMRRESFPVPTLALNDVPLEGPPRENLYLFSLSPEEEARQVAERTWLDGFGRAATLVPKGEWGERIDHAFSERWTQLGGDIVATEAYEPKQNDFSRPLMRMLKLDESNRRHRLLMDTLGQRLEMTPRRRQDIDFIFLAALPRQARLIRPQLRFHHAAHLPVYATSHVFSATLEPDQDRDMDGIIFGDMPWTLDSASQNRGPRRDSEDALATYEGQWQRLLALGFDAYNLIPLHKVLAHYPHERFPGETGTLRLDETRHIVRTLVWARFQDGIPRLIGEGLPLSEAN